jgi:ribosome-associated protein
MKDTLQTEKTAENTSPEKTAIELGKMLQDHNGGAVVVMDMRQLNFWTDFFVIATITSNTHLSGLERHIKEFAREKGLEILRRSQKPADTDDEWALIDLGDTVIHLMTNRTRSFFELERLWSSAPLIYEDSSYSSKSS